MKYEIVYDTSFVRQYKKLPEDLKKEVKEKIELLKHKKHHESLRVHKLKGRLAKFYSFSVTYSHRIIFEFIEKDTMIFIIKFGSHDIYN